MSKVKIEGNASGTGTLTISAPNTNTDRTLTLPDGAGEILTDASTLSSSNLSGALPAIDGSSLTGVVPDDIPIFSAYAPTNGTITQNTWTILIFGTEQYDTVSAYTTSNGRFQPLIEGYYWIGVSLEHNGTTRQICKIVKHSSLNEDYFIWDTQLTNSGTDLSGSTLTYLNGSTDYVDVQVYGSGGDYTISTDLGRSMFQGYLVRKA